MTSVPLPPGSPEHRVGVVIPVYNTGTLVINAAHSASLALGHHSSIVLVDDGSTDRQTLMALQRLRREGFRVIRQANRGVSAARNAGITALDTPFIIALDSDDEILPDAPSLMADEMETDEAVAIVTGGAIEVENGSERTVAPPEASEPVTRESMRDFTLLLMASLFRRSDWQAVGGFPEGLAFGEDWVFWMRLLRVRPKVASLERTVARRHLGDHQVTRRSIDPRATARARAIVRQENTDLYRGLETELIEQLNLAEEQLAAYRHAYRHFDRLKATIRHGLRRG